MVEKQKSANFSNFFFLKNEKDYQIILYKKVLRAVFYLEKACFKGAELSAAGLVEEVVHVQAHVLALVL